MVQSYLIGSTVKTYRLVERPMWQRLLLFWTYKRQWATVTETYEVIDVTENTLLLEGDSR